MQIVSVSAQFSEQNIKAALDILQVLKQRTQSAAGLKEYEIYVDPIQPTNVFLYQIWQSRADFETYRTSADFAKMGEELAPLMTSAPQTDIFNAEKQT